MSETDAVILNETGAQSMIGYELDVGGGDGQARCVLQVGPEHGNRQGVLHGGIAASLLDNALGATASLAIDPTGRHPFTTISLNIDFIAPGRPGRVVATGRKVGGGYKLLFIEGDLVHEDGTLIAKASGVFKRGQKPDVPA